jgi:hypothetical protein
MLLSNYVHLAIDPVITPLVGMAILKLFGVGVAGGTVGHIAGQAATKGKVDLGKAVSSGVDVAGKSISVANSTNAALNQSSSQRKES